MVIGFWYPFSGFVANVRWSLVILILGWTPPPPPVGDPWWSLFRVETPPPPPPPCARWSLFRVDPYSGIYSTYFAMQRRSVCAEVKPSPRKNVPWTSRYMDWYVFHLHRWTDSRPNWRQLQLGTLGKSCAKVEATSDRQIDFLLERQRQAPF